jgi:FKBP-type peptidyl-prolyl cis-trans isomerase
MRSWPLIPLLLLGAASCKPTPAEGEADPEEKLDRPVLTKDLEVGEGPEVKEAYRVMVEYVGRYPGGDVVFDRNDQKDEDGKPLKAPYAIRVGANKVIKGLEEGLVGIKKGGHRIITIPWQKGYGKDGTSDGNIPGKQDLEFDVKVIDIVAPEDENTYDFTDVKLGSGREVKDGDKVVVHYRAAYANGMVFDDSKLRGENGTPLVFKVGGREVIKGVEAGVVGMKVGGIRKLWLAPMLVYGDVGYQTIQGGQVVLVDLELLAIE